MHLKKLELIGFKSFADKTEVIFDQGVTCVVGPNGCGKSNISDSIRWVLGERSAKLLRGAKMEDVIFSGTDFRKPLSFAEVSLTFDNADRGLPIDYSEVTLTRRLYRSGQSEYLINKTVVRLKDVQDLILDTGIGSNSYSMIEQGRIDYILNADPEERRFLIEEAAGISKYKVKKEEAIRKLERTEENMLRINDIIHEVEKNIQYAERQAKRAEKYKEKFEQLKSLEIRKAFHDLNRIQSEKQNLEDSKNQKTQETDQYQAQKTATTEKLTGLENHSRDIREKYSREESGRYALLTQREKNEQQLQFNREKRVELATRKGEIQQERLHLEERLSKNAKEIQEKQKELSGFTREHDNLVNSLQSAETHFKQTEQKVNEIKKQLEQAKADAYEIAAEMSRARNDFHRVVAFLESSDKQKFKMNGNLSRYSKERREWETKKSEYEERLKTLQIKISEIEEQENQSARHIQELEASLKSEEIYKNEFSRSRHEKETRLAMLLELDQAAGMSKEKALEILSETEKKLISGLREIVKVKAGYEVALEAALGAYATSLVVDDLVTAKKMIKHFTAHKNHALRLWIRSQGQRGLNQAAALQPPSNPWIQCALTDVLEIAPGFENLIRPMLNQTYILKEFHIEQLDQLLLDAENFCFVTMEGLCIGPHGQVHSHSGAAGEHQLFKRDGEIRHLKQEIEAIQEKIELHTKNYQRLSEELEKAQAAMDGIQNSSLEFKIQKESFESLKRGVDERLSAHGREVQLVMQEILELDGQHGEVQARKQNLEKRLEELAQKETAHREQESIWIKNLNSNEEERNQALHVASERRAQFRQYEQQAALLQGSLNLLNETDQENRKRIETIQEELVRIQQKEQELQDWDVRLNQELQEISEKMRQADISLGRIHQDRDQIEAEINLLKTSVQEFNEKQQRLQQELHQLEMKIMDSAYQEKALVERMGQAYHIKLYELDSSVYAWEDRDQAEIDAEIAALREKVDQMGTVNLLAIEEYDELKKRFDFLDGQKKDLEQARTELLEAIRKINKTTKSLFEETLAKVQTAFQEYYQTLFRGGEARLVLVDESQPLESGIDIVVRPPGKKPQHMSLLSGGEKALTAMALLFALFKIKPSPYSVLDEVDAPLDEANIDRFLSVLRTFLGTSQFIIITHNRKTIAMGDALYGVTMEEAGISKLVSVRVGSEASALDRTVTVRQDKVENTVPLDTP